MCQIFIEEIYLRKCKFRLFFLSFLKCNLEDWKHNIAESYKAEYFRDESVLSINRHCHCANQLDSFFDCKKLHREWTIKRTLSMHRRYSRDILQTALRKLGFLDASEPIGSKRTKLKNICNIPFRLIALLSSHVFSWMLIDIANNYRR